MTIELSRAAKMRAARAIAAVHTAYHEKDGIRQLELALDEKRGAAARHVYALAVFAAEQHKKREDAIALYLSMCQYAEAQYKAEHEVANLKDALPTWAVFKSNILRGMREFQLDPREHRSEGAFRVAMQKAEPAERQAASVTALPVQRSPEQIEDYLASTVHHDSLRVLVSQIIFQLENLKGDKPAIRAAEGVLRETMNKLQPNVDATKVAAAA